MFSRTHLHWLLAAGRCFGFACLVWAASGCVAPLQAQQQDSFEDDFQPSAAPGKRIFVSSCAGCHGLDGRGGERAPNIAGSAKVRRLSNAEIAAIVTNGVSGTGMPAFHSLSPAQVQAVVSYLRLLQGREKSQQTAGDAKRGKAIFFGKAGCSSCHMVQGDGGFLGADLSSYGSNRGAKEIANAILDPANNTDWKRKAATVITREGHSINGLIRNEDNFSVQLQTPDAAFYFFWKSELKSFEYQDRPFMPTDYSQRLSENELQDLVNYLLSAGRNSQADSAAHE